MRRSRLRKRLEKKTKKTIFFSILGILLTLFILVKFGIPLLANLALTMSDLKSSNETVKKDDAAFVAPPVLDTMTDATNSAQIKIKGLAMKNQKINLYINDKLVDKVSTENNGSFEFEDVILEDGENKIQAKAITDSKKESEFSNLVNVIFKKDAPKLSIDNPSDNQSFSKDDKMVNVSGKTDPGVKVTVNDFWAIVDDSGNFSYRMTLNDGENSLKIAAVDQAGNKTEAEKKVTYSP